MTIKATEADRGTGNQVQLDASAEGSPWAYACRLLGGRGRLLALFALLVALLTAGGHQILAPASNQPFVWPAAGLLFGFLWLGDRRFWPQLLLIQFVVELATGLLVSQLPWKSLLAGTLAHSCAALVGAAYARHRFGGRTTIKIHILAQFTLAAAALAVVSAPFSAIAGMLAGPNIELSQWLLVAMLADLLGGLLIVPVLLTWSIPRRNTFPLLSRRMIIELVVLAVAQALLVVYIFAPPQFGLSALHLPPALILPLMLYAAARFPPRWGTLLVLGTALLACSLVSNGANLHAISDPFARTLWMQITTATVIGLAIMLIAYLTSHRLGMADLADAEGRYRNFVELSNEAMWRVELLQPMPITFSHAQQCAWLREHARIVERSDSYVLIEGAGNPAHWTNLVPWVPAFEARAGRVREGKIMIADLPFNVAIGDYRRSYLSSFHGVIEDGKLLRLWGVARDVTELVELNAKLQREQGRLKSYSQRALTVEEQGRRVTAMDLHDSIGQELVGMSLTLKALSDQLPAAQQQLLEGMRSSLDHMQSRTRDLIADLSPPGLYDFGLEAALQWLADELHSRDNLRVALACSVDESRLWLDLRVVVFNVARELLRNVVKHAGVEHATLTVSSDNHALVVRLQDEGCGFEWHPELHGTFHRGFGLLSVVERVASEKGTFTVDTAHGRGATFTMEFPLRDATSTTYDRSHAPG